MALCAVIIITEGSAIAGDDDINTSANFFWKINAILILESQVVILIVIDDPC